MKLLKCKLLTDNDGSIMIAALLMLVALSLAVFMASDNSLTNSRMMRNSRDYRNDLYRAESGISTAVELHKTTWLDSDSDLFDMDAGNASITNNNVQLNDEDGNPIAIASYQIARIENYEDSDIDSKLDDDALTRDFFSLGHTAPPQVGSGMSPANFEIRRYGIDSTAVPRDGSNNSITIESGLSKLFNKYS